MCSDTVQRELLLHGAASGSDVGPCAPQILLAQYDGKLLRGERGKAGHVMDAGTGELKRVFVSETLQLREPDEIPLVLFEDG